MLQTKNIIIYSYCISCVILHNKSIKLHYFKLSNKAVFFAALFCWKYIRQLEKGRILGQNNRAHISLNPGWSFMPVG